jgi:hypothetical protein
MRLAVGRVYAVSPIRRRGRRARNREHCCKHEAACARSGHQTLIAMSRVSGAIFTVIQRARVGPASSVTVPSRSDAVATRSPEVARLNEPYGTSLRLTIVRVPASTISIAEPKPLVMYA